MEGFAEFWILLSPGPTVRGIKFVNGDEELKSFEKDSGSSELSRSVSGGNGNETAAQGQAIVYEFVARL